MKAFIKNILILANILSITACTAYFWNGYYSLQKTREEMERERNEYYSKETLGQQELRKKNQIICDDLINKKYPKPIVIENGIYKRQSLYIDCMKERGSPVY